ncbi:IS3 family transposase [Ralstonia pseudosolanacearum]|uniref:IS3 family transposase n=1 Tax=Ralstonia pseudosolanacearum TaxID=1310165 RepID=UPI00352935F3
MPAGADGADGGGGASHLRDAGAVLPLNAAPGPTPRPVTAAARSRGPRPPRCAHQHTRPSAAKLRQEVHVRAVFAASGQSYGSRRVMYALRAQGEQIGRYRIRPSVSLVLRRGLPRRFHAMSLVLLCHKK